MKERPILFSGEMVRAILEGRKTQTRRIIKVFPEYHKGTEAPQAKRGEPPRHPSPYFDCYCNKPRTEANPRGMSDRWCWWDEYDRMGNGWLKCPFGVPGDRLWVRETWCELRVGHFNELGFPRDLLVTRYDHPRRNGAAYRATCSAEGDAIRGGYGYRWKPSIHMPRWASRITLEVTGVRVERLRDIRAADAEAEGFYTKFCSSGGIGGSAVDKFSQLWRDTYGRGSWLDNPWVWVIEFKRIEVPA